MAQRNVSAGGVKQQVKQNAEQVKQNAQQVAEHPWFKTLARFGYAAKGSVYLIAGVLSARAAFGLGGATTDKQGALRTLLSEPFGRILLILIGIGLIGYVLFRLTQAAMDPEQKGGDAKGVAARLVYVVSAIIYAVLAFSAFRLAIGVGSAEGNQGQDWISRMFQVPLGRWLVGLAGLIVIGSGFYQLYKAYKTDFSEHMRWNEMSATEHTWIVRLGRLGLAARGIVQLLIGWFLTQAALTFDPGKVQGTEGALNTLAQPPFGSWMLGVVALGLAAYGVYMLAVARYSRIVTSGANAAP